MDYNEQVDFLNECTLKYEKGESSISDKEFDTLLRKVRKTELLTGFIREDSPTVIIASSKGRVNHPTPMYSMKDAFTNIEIKKWLSITLANEYIIMPKFDGISLNLLYEKGRLVRAITRGDGRTGEDVTFKVRYIKGIPTSIPTQEKLEIRGEAVISRDDFYKLTSSGYSFKNARNAVAGTMNLEDINEFKRRRLSFVPWGSSLKTPTHEETLLTLFSFGFKSYEHSIVTSLSQISKYFLGLDTRQESFKVDLDGLAIRVNDNEAYHDLGTANKYPKGIIAYKFSTEEKVTKLVNVVNQIGRTGVQTPVAILEPVELSGATVTRATLHNWNNVEELGVSKGCEVLITRSGGVIPKILTVVNDGETPIVTPTKCGYCNGPLTVTNSGLICNNLNCDGRLIMDLISFASREKMDISGLAGSIITELFQHEVIKVPADIYNLDEDDLKGLLGMKTIDNLLTAIESSKGKDIVNVLSSLNIPHVGKTYWKKIIDREMDIFNLKYSELEKIPGLGRVTIGNILRYMKENKSDVTYLLSVTEAKYDKPTGEKYKDRVFYLTGTLDKPRREYVKLITKEGGEVVKTINKRITDFIVGVNASKSKISKAELLKLNMVKGLG